MKGGRFFGYRVDSASSRAYYISEHVLGALDEDLACALYGGCDVQFSGAIPWLDSKEVRAGLWHASQVYCGSRSGVWDTR